MRKLLLLLSLSLYTGLQAQDFLGLQSSNYSGVLGAYSNPANIVDNRFKVDVAIIGLHTTVDNNYFGVKRKSLKHTGGIFNPGDIQLTDPSWDDNNPNSPTYWKNNYRIVNNGKSKSGYMSNRVVLPSFLVSINSKNAIALNLSVRNYVNIDGISQQFADIAYSEFIYPSVFLTRLSNKNLSIQQMSWAECGLSYARVLKDDNEHFFKAGVTVKILQGLEAAYLHIRDLQYRLDAQDTVSFFNTSVAYGHSDNLNASGSGDAYTFKMSPGVGFDIGGVYEWRPDYKKYKYDMDGKTNLWRKDKNKYRLKASLAINDIGGIRYKKGELSNDFTLNINQYNVNKFQNINSIAGFDSLVKKDFPTSNKSNTFKVALPTAINAQVDYNIWKPFYVNLGFNLTNFYKKREAKVHEYTSISIAPRFDHKWFGVTIPISYNSLAGRRGDYTAVGAMVRVGPLVVGSNDLLNYVTKDVFGANFYFLLKVPIPYGHKRDRDNDGISDRKDKCKTVPGVWEFKGCPDIDGDHIPDSEDKCPTIAGPKELQGCPDRDGDGITDAEDACPDNKGTKEFNGCPDTDGDKIIDKNDDCPDEAGFAEFKGCPDRDADGTPDKDDACPDTFGPKENKGCPDKDLDGILDKDDACPDQAGPTENMGCPWPDSDKDGVFDKDDACPTVPGVPELKGCPKADVAFNPNVQTVPMKAAEKKIIEKAFASLEFATAKDVIKPKSLPALNDLAKLLIAHSEDWKLKLSGHTDNEGNAEKNLILSEKRATAVKTYLTKKGVKNEQIMTEWFGQTMPFADNKTPAGRQKNRRVEMKIVLKE